MTHYIPVYFMQYRVMGTPTEDTWPGVTSLPDFKSSFPKWPSKVIKLGLLRFFLKKHS